MSNNSRDLALFNLAIDSKLRGCDLVKLKVSDISQGPDILHRTTLIQQKTNQPVQFEITIQTRDSLSGWIKKANLVNADCLFPSSVNVSSHLSTRQHARIVDSWIASIGLNKTLNGKHTMRRKCSYPFDLWKMDYLNCENR